MNNNDYVNLLTTIAHEKGKDRKLLLKMEIAKATDPLVKEQLQLLLEEQESQERRNKFIAGIFFAVLFVAFILIFMKWIFYPNNEIKTNAASSTTVSTVANTNDDTQSSSSLSDRSTAEQETRKEAVQSQISDSQNYSTTNLSENEAIAWIKSYLHDSGNMHEQAIENSVFISELDPNNFLQVTVHSNNRLAAIFRIDGNGDLQETRDFAYLSDWETVRTAQDYVGN